MKITLLTIDPQVDFCDPSGALAVAGADKDMERLSKMVIKHKEKIDDIRVTLDSHQLVHIAHPIFWVDSNGNHPNPFTPISLEDVQKGKYKTYNPAFQKRALDYVEKLERNGRYSLFIWSFHCLIGTKGYSVCPCFSDALIEWQKEFAMIDWVTKGSNPFTEHYSAIQADVPDPEDPSTEVNTSFIQRLQEADRILVAGEASSHCLKTSVEDCVSQFGDEQAKKLVLLEDCMSPVTGFESAHDDFMNWAKNKGIQISKSTEFFA